MSRAGAIAKKSFCHIPTPTFVFEFFDDIGRTRLIVFKTNIIILLETNVRCKSEEATKKKEKEKKKATGLGNFLCLKRTSFRGEIKEETDDDASLLVLSYVFFA